MGTREIFRVNLKYYRKLRGLTQEELSARIGYGETYITEIESRHKFPKPETIDHIASNLGIEPYKLFRPLEGSSDKQVLLTLRRKIEDLFDGILIE